MNDYDIPLTRQELRALRRCQTEPIPLAGNECLVRHKLACEIIEPVQGYFGNRTGKLEITDFGIDYLRHLDRQAADLRQARRHDWLIALLSTFGGALLSKPVWAVLSTVVDWLKPLG